MNVVIRFVDMLGKYYICHAGSYQNAFRSSVNGFESRTKAKKFAIANGCTIVVHDFDPLQAEGHTNA